MELHVLKKLLDRLGRQYQEMTGPFSLDTAFGDKAETIIVSGVIQLAFDKHGSLIGITP